MALDFTLIPISFGQGLDTKTDRKQVLPGKLLELENGVFSNLGSINKRYGYDQLSLTIDGGDSVGSGDALSTYRNELLLFGDDGVYSRLSANDKWAYRGAISSVIQNVKNIVNNGAQQLNPDVNAILNFECVAWEDDRGGIRYSLSDSITGAFITADASVSTTGTSPRVVTFSNYAVIFFIDSSSLKFRVINISAPSILLPEQIAATNFGGVYTKRFDACANQDRIYFSYTDDVGGTTIGYLNSQLSVTAGEHTDGYAINTIGMWADSNANVWVAYHDTTALKAYVRSFALTSVLSTTTVDSLTTTIKTVTGIETADGTSQIFYEVDATLPSEHRIRTNTLTRSGTPGAVSVLVRSLGLASKAFSYNGNTYIGATYQSTYQSKYLTLNSTGAVIAKAVSGNGGGLRTNGTLSNVAEISDGVFLFAASKKQRTLSENNRIFSLLGVVGISLDFTSENKFITSELGDHLFVVGGITQSYDGISFTEHNFHFYPEADGISLTLGPGPSGGTGGTGGGGTPPDTTNPTCTLTSPTTGSTVSSTITLTASASDNIAVTRVEFYVDGSLIGTDYNSPYTYGYDTTALSNGAHTVQAKAYDAAGNIGSSSTSNITVSNSAANLQFTRQIRGTNSAGGEVYYGVSNTTSPVENTDYLFLTNTDIDYLYSKGMNFIRIVVSWEILQPALNGALATTGNAGAYKTTLVNRVNYATGLGMYVLIEPHGASDSQFAKYQGVRIGTSPVTAAAFADFWSRMATLFLANNKVMFGMSNEPNFMSSSAWWTAQQTACDAIRDAGFTGLVMLEGNAYSHALSWTTTSPYGGDTDATPHSNAYYAALFTDKLATINPTNYPDGNFCFQVHEYFNSDAGGGATDVVSTSIGVTRVGVMMDWCIANNKRFFLGEFAAKAGVTNASGCISNLLAYLDSNRTNCLGWAWWGYGPPSWWGAYQFTMCPTSAYTVDSPQYALISAYLPAP